MFKDLSQVKLDRNMLHDPVDSGNGAGPVGCGCFGVVYHKRLQLDQVSSMYMYLDFKHLYSFSSMIQIFQEKLL